MFGPYSVASWQYGLKLLLRLDPVNRPGKFNLLEQQWLTLKIIKSIQEGVCKPILESRDPSFGEVRITRVKGQ